VYSFLTNPIYWLIGIIGVLGGAVAVLTMLRVTSTLNTTSGEGPGVSMINRRVELPHGWEGTVYDARTCTNGTVRLGLVDLYHPDTKLRRSHGWLIAGHSEPTLILDAPQHEESSFELSNEILRLRRELDALRAQNQALAQREPKVLGIEDVMGPKPNTHKNGHTNGKGA